jgi:hypothetical protein
MPHNLLVREVAMPTEEQIRQLAHSLWEQEGRPEGKDREHYLTAKGILEQQEAAQGRAKAHSRAAPKSSAKARSRTASKSSAKPRARSPRAKK